MEKNPVESFFGLVADVAEQAARGAINAGARRVQTALRKADDKLMGVRALTRTGKPAKRRRTVEVEATPACICTGVGGKDPRCPVCSVPR